MYTTPCCTIGFAVSDPYGVTPSAAFPVSLNDHACVSRDTFDEVIVEPVAFRVFARSSFEYGHDPEVPAVEMPTFAATVWQPAPARAEAVLVRLLLPPPHAAASSPVTTTRAMAGGVRPFVLGLRFRMGNSLRISLCYQQGQARV